MYTDLLVALALSLAITLILETGFFLLTGKRNKKDLLLVILVNTHTNPLVVLLHWLASRHTNWNMVIVTIALEAYAVLAEAFLYKRYAQSIKRPLIFSFAANAFSYLIGVLVQSF